MRPTRVTWLLGPALVVSVVVATAAALPGGAQELTPPQEPLPQQPELQQPDAQPDPLPAQPDQPVQPDPQQQPAQPPADQAPVPDDAPAGQTPTAEPAPGEAPAQEQDEVSPQPDLLVPGPSLPAEGDDPAATSASDSGDGGLTYEARVRLVVLGLLIVAVVVAVLTFFYWRHTRPRAAPQRSSEGPPQPPEPTPRDTARDEPEPAWLRSDPWQQDSQTSRSTQRPRIVTAEDLQDRSAQR